MVREGGQWEQEAVGQQGEKGREARNRVIDLLYFYLNTFKQFLFHPQHCLRQPVKCLCSCFTLGKKVSIVLSINCKLLLLCVRQVMGLSSAKKWLALF